MDLLADLVDLYFLLRNLVQKLQYLLCFDVVIAAIAAKLQDVLLDVPQSAKQPQCKYNKHQHIC